MKLVARWIIKVLSHIDNSAVEREVHEEVLALCQKFPVPGIDV
jgi:glycine/serine hydroxymethyltransferase